MFTICAGPTTRLTATFGLTEEQQFSEYSFDRSDATAIRSEFELHEKQAKELLEGFKARKGRNARAIRFFAAYDHCLKCSHLFNLMDARGVISTTERAALMARVRTLACRTAAAYLEQIGGPSRVSARGAEMSSRCGKGIEKRVELLFEVGCEEIPAGMLAQGGRGTYAPTSRNFWPPRICSEASR